MWRSCHSVSHPSVTPPVASVATQTDHGFPEEGGQEDFGVEGTPAQWHLFHRSYLAGRTTHPASFPVGVDGVRWLAGDASQWNEGEVKGTRIYEEVTLHRCSKEAKFGLTLWYQSGSDVICPSDRIECDDSGTEVYIGEIDPNGIAAKDGRARLGDKIVQINGESVKSRDQVLRLLRSDLPFITLLLSRTNPVCQPDDGFTDDLDALESLSFEYEKEHRAVQLECIDEECDDATEDDETGATESESQRQDSGFGKTTDDSTRNEESSEQEVIDDGIVSPLADCSFHDRHQKSSDSFGSMDCHESDQDELPSVFQCQQFYEMLKERCNAELVSSTLPIPPPAARTTRPPLPPPPPLPPTRDDHAMLKRPGRYRDDVATLGIDVAALHLEDSGGAAHDGRSSRGSVVATRKVPRMGTRIQTNPPSSCLKGRTSSVVMRQYFVAQPPSSANDFESGNDDRTNNVSGINAGECLSPFDISQNFVNFSPPGPNISTVNGSTAGGHHGSCSGTSLTLMKTKTSQMCQTDDEGDYEVLVPLDHLFPRPSPHGGHHQLLENSVHAGVSAGPLATKPADGNLRTNHSSETPSQLLSKNFPAGTTGAQCAAPVPAASELEWVVKRRSDGSRYITRRPVKNRVPKERERVRKIPDEDRSGQTTADDDVHRTTRNGTKEDKRRHMEKSRIRRRGKESSATAVTRQRPVGERGEDHFVEEHPSIAQLSRRKMMKFRGRNVLDDFTTLQELLTHGSREPRHTRSNGHHLLSVTTV